MKLYSTTLKTGEKCSECEKAFDQATPNQKTCGSQPCRYKRQRRLEKLKKV